MEFVQVVEKFRNCCSVGAPCELKQAERNSAILECVRTKHTKFGLHQLSPKDLAAINFPE